MAIGILVLMLSLAGQVFTITVQSTGKATALTEVSQQLRLFEETLRADLAAVDPQRTLLVIQGNPVNAFWTQDNLEAGAAVASGGQGNPSDGYPHAKDPDREDLTADAAVQARGGRFMKPRADILFFYTARPAASSLDPQVTSNLQQVVYGHAALGEYTLVAGAALAAPVWEFNPNSGDPDNAQQFFPQASVGAGYPDPTRPSLIPAQQWHLARRGTLFVPTGSPPGAISPPLFGTAEPAVQNRERLVRGAADVVTLHNVAAGVRFPFECLALHPTCDVLSPSFELHYRSEPPYFLPYILSESGQEPFLRSELDVTPPPSLLNASDQFYGLGHYMLPNCASFKVEWALDPRSPFVNGRLDGLAEAIWFDPGDEGIGSEPADSLRALRAKIDSLEAEINAATGAAKDALENTQKQLVSLLTDPHFDGGMSYSLADRFRGVGGKDTDPARAWKAPALALDRRMNLAIFTANRPARRGDTNLDGVIDEEDFDFQDLLPDPMFPGALRITVDVFDNRARLDRPIRHVMVIPIGS